MRITLIPLLLLACTCFVACVSINNSHEQTIGSDEEQVLGLIDTVSMSEETQIPIDSLINSAARFYAGVSSEGIAMSNEDRASWKKYADSMQKNIEKSRKTLSLVDSLVNEDMQDVRSKADLVFYPFSGPDVLYPITMFPDADTYLLVGLEKAGSIAREIKTGINDYRLYRKALEVYLRSSFFRTLSMEEDFSNDTIDGTLPVICLLMAVSDCEIVSVEHKVITEVGTLEDSSSKTNCAEVKFCRQGSHQVKTLYYLSANVKSRYMDGLVQKYLDRTLRDRHVVTFLKAASYLMHEPTFDKIRNYILNYSFSVIQDDSGIPYRFFDGWDLTFYGNYMRPLGIFDEHNYQRDLQAVYDSVMPHRLPFRIGYNNPSNWMCARKINR